MARVLVRSWQETYRGLMPDRVLDDPGLVERSRTVLDRCPRRRTVQREQGRGG